MARLFGDGRDLASVEVASSFAQRFRGLLGRDHLDGAMVITKASSVHTIGMRFAVDVAFCDHAGVVIDVVTMQPYAVSMPRRRGRWVVEASAGRMAQWKVSRGCRLEVRP